MPNRIWVDVEDLFQYAAFNARPSGIQRIEFELCRALASMPESRDRVGFLRHVPHQGSVRAIPFAEVDALHRRLVSTPPAPGGSAEIRPAAPLRPGLARRIAYRIPLDLRDPLVRLVKAQREIAGAVGSLGGAAVSRLRPDRHQGRGALAEAEPQDRPDRLTVAEFADTVRPGDVLLVLGSTWFHPFYDELVGRLRARHGLRMALLVYDLIPLIRPEWCDANLVLRFKHWARLLLPQADTLLTISQASGEDLRRVASREGLELQATPWAIPIGTGFSAPVSAPQPADREPEAGLPAAGSYVLIVSTIEARKNHTLLFRVWRRLLDEMPAERVPTLVFAGRIGWLVEDLMQQLRNADRLGGKIRVIENPQDETLERLYRGCLFTVFPSFYEGWGLPVTESFCFGRPCVISNASALPEAGGALARYHDPEDGNEAYRVIRHAIEDEAGTRAWGERVAAEFRPVPWEESARSILRAVDQGQPRSEQAG